MDSSVVARNAKTAVLGVAAVWKISKISYDRIPWSSAARQ
jgi:hypothetical protein